METNAEALSTIDIDATGTAIVTFLQRAAPTMMGGISESAAIGRANWAFETKEESP